MRWTDRRWLKPWAVGSLPEPLATHAGRPGRVDDVPGEGLTVLHAFEQSTAELRDLPQLAATLAAALEQAASPPLADQTQPAGHRPRSRLAVLRRLATLGQR